MLLDIWAGQDFGTRFAALDAEAVAAALAECHAAEWRGRDYATLSLGEQMRVQLARSLYQLGRPLSSTEPQSPCLWLLDEPCAHLDMAQRHFVLTLIARIAREREWAVVFSTHDPMEAQLIADRVHLLLGGVQAPEDFGRVATKVLEEEKHQQDDAQQSGDHLPQASYQVGRHARGSGSREFNKQQALAACGSQGLRKQARV